MSKEVSISYKKAYVEVSKILQFLPKEEYEKIPKGFIKLIEENKLEEYSCPINSIEELDKDKLTYEAQMILLVIYNSYLASEEERKRIEQTLIENEKKYLKEINEKYNPDNIFKKKEIKQEDRETTTEKTDKNLELPVEYHETLFNKIISFLKKIFRRRR